MFFNSWAFAVFLPTVLAVYFTLSHRAQNVFLLLASYVFYGWWDYRFLALLGFSTVLDYYLGNWIAAAPNKARKLTCITVSCVANLGFLGFFKYFNFFVDSAARVLEAVGIEAHMPTLRIILPAGISFYTFQSMCYTIDIYRGQLKPARTLLDFALYVAFFPQLVAGPIERATTLLPQVEAPRTVNNDQWRTGWSLILIGICRKVAIADSAALIVNEIFPKAESEGSFQLLIALYLFSIQIYADFAGYSDVARGSARLMGFELMRNFEHPYFSTSITEFWRRWHISLSTWLRDYLYVPLGGNRHGHFMTYRNLFLTMLLGGLWHGASWNFVIWGGLHGVYLAIHKLMLGDRRPAADNRIRTIGGVIRNIVPWFITLNLVALSWIFFRAETFDGAWQYLSGIFAFRGEIDLRPVKYLLACTAMLAIIDIPQYLSGIHTICTRWAWWLRGAYYAALFLAICFFRSEGNVPFIYFQF